MSFGSGLVLIEFLEGTDKRAAGSRMKVDAGSATSLCDVQKVAKRVTDATAAEPVTPAPVAAVDIEPEDTPPADVDTDH